MILRCQDLQVQETWQHKVRLTLLLGMTAVIRKGSTPAMVSSVECSLMAICILSIGTELFVNLEVSHLLGVREDSSSLEIC